MSCKKCHYHSYFTHGKHGLRKYLFGLHISISSKQQKWNYTTINSLICCTKMVSRVLFLENRPVKWLYETHVFCQCTSRNDISMNLFNIDWAHISPVCALWLEIKHRLSELLIEYRIQDLLGDIRMTLRVIISKSFDAWLQ